MLVVMDKRLTDKIVHYFATQPIVKAWVFGSSPEEKFIVEAISTYW